MANSASHRKRVYVGLTIIVQVSFYIFLLSLYSFYEIYEDYFVLSGANNANHCYTDLAGIEDEVRR